MSDIQQHSLKDQDQKLLEALAAAPSGWHRGLHLGDLAGVAPGLAYPSLARLERLGAVESRWEEAPGGGERRAYRITGAGQQIAMREPAPAKRWRLRLQLPPLGWPEGGVA